MIDNGWIYEVLAVPSSTMPAVCLYRTDNEACAREDYRTQLQSGKWESVRLHKIRRIELERWEK